VVNREVAVGVFVVVRTAVVRVGAALVLVLVLVGRGVRVVGVVGGGFLALYMHRGPQQYAYV
jgi:hypothetical protein